MNIHWCIIVSIKLPFYGCMHHVTKRKHKNSTATWGISIARDNNSRVRDLTDCPRSSWGKRWRQHVNPRLLGREKVALSAGSP